MSDDWSGEVIDASESVTAPTPVTVAQARDAYEDAYYEWRSERKNVAASVAIELAIEADKAWSALIAAVRAECAADTKRLDWLEAFGKSGTGLYAESNASHFDWSQGSLRAAIDHAMQEAHP